MKRILFSAVLLALIIPAGLAAQVSVTDLKSGDVVRMTLEAPEVEGASEPPTVIAGAAGTIIGGFLGAASPMTRWVRVVIP